MGVDTSKPRQTIVDPPRDTVRARWVQSVEDIRRLKREKAELDAMLAKMRAACTCGAASHPDDIDDG